MDLMVRLLMASSATPILQGFEDVEGYALPLSLIQVNVCCGSIRWQRFRAWSGDGVGAVGCGGQDDAERLSLRGLLLASRKEMQGCWVGCQATAWLRSPRE